jgi:hypothetical protein
MQKLHQIKCFARKKQKVKKQCKSRSQCSKKVVNYDHEVQWHYDVQKKECSFRGRLNCRPKEVPDYQYLARCVSAGGRKETMGRVENCKCSV